MTQERQNQNAWETDGTTAEQERRNREFFADILEHSSQPVGVGYPDGRLGLVNKAFEELTGYTADELRSIDWATALTPPEWLGMEREKLEELHRTGCPVRYEKEYIRKDRSRLPIEMLVHLVRDSQGAPEYYYSFITDISERKHAEEALRESENRVRQKLESIFSSDGDLGVLELADILDIPAVQSLMNDFYKLAGIPMAIIDLKGDVLVGVGWQEICVRFHRSHPESCQYCIESDLELTKGVAPGEYRLYRCKNNMWDIATPIMVGGQHVGNLFSGQFIFDDETPDYEFFRAQAKRYGFDEKAYIAALDRVKRISRESLDDAMSFFTKLADMLSKLSYGNIRLAKSVAERDALVEAARQSEERFRVLAETIPGIVWIASPSGSVEWINQRWSAYTGQKTDESLGWGWQSAMHPDDSASADVLWDEVQISGKVYEHEERIRRHDGEYRWFLARGLPVRDAEGKIVRWFGANTDINDLKETQQALEESEQRLNRSQEIAHLGSWELDLVRNKLTWSDEVYRIFGLEPQQFGATYEAFLEAVHPDDRAAVDEAYSASLREGRDTYEIEHRVVRRSDGETRIVHERCEHVRDGAGQIIRSIGMVHDITEPKQAEQALRDSENRHRFLTENMKDVVWTLDMETMRFLYVSPSVQDLRGYSAEEIIARPVDDALTPEGSEYVRSQIQDRLARFLCDETASVYYTDYVDQPCRDGSLVSTEVITRYYRNPETGNIEVHGVTRDITKRKQAEEALRETEERYRTLFTHMSEGFALCEIILDANGQPCDFRYLEANEAFEKHTGMKLSDSIGRTVREIIPGIEPYWIETYGKVALTGEPVLFENRVEELHKDFEVIAFSPSKGRFAAVFLDITSRKRAEQELRELAQRLNSHMENSPLAVIEWDADYRVIRWSDEATHVFGWTAQDIIGKRIDDVRWVYEEDWPIVAKLMEDMNAGIRPRNVNPNRNYCKDGSVIWCEWYNSVLKDDSGSMISVLSLVLDVTDRELAERELSRTRAEAQQRAAELESFVHSMADGVVLFDTEAKVLLANEAFKKILGVPHGVPAEEWSRQYELQTLDGDPIPLTAWPSRRALNGEEIANERFKVVTPWRESITSMSGSPVRDAGGAVIGGTMAFRDVTHLVELERQATEIHEREHRIADILQKALIPEAIYDVPGCDIAVRYEPALKEAEVGGDFYDIFDLGDGKLAVLIGDVAGKGLAAAIRVAAARHSIRSYAFLDPRPSKVMTLANDALCRDDEEAGMLTAFLAIIDTRVGIVTYSSGGHEPPVVKRVDGGTELLDVQGRVMGAAPNWVYPEHSRLLRPGDILMMVTDGITEARPDPLNLFGVEGVQNYLSRTQETSIEDIAEGLLEAAKKHAGGPLSDDAAIVAITLREGS